MKRYLQIGNIASLVFALVMNALVGARLINVPAINEISDKYSTLLTPAGYAFSIWSLIYFMLIIFAVYQARDIFKLNDTNTLPEKTGLLFIVANICNGLWTYIFVKEFISVSVIVLVILTSCLYALLYRLRIALDNVPKSVIVAVWWPLLLYTGWVTVATVVNIVTWLEYLNVTLTSLAAISILVVLFMGLLLLLTKRNVRELVLASTWGIAAIGVAQSGNNALVANVAFSVSALLVLAIFIHAIYKHRAFITKPIQ